MDFIKLESYLSDHQEPKYRFSQIVSDVVTGRPKSFADIFTIPKHLRDDLSEVVPFISNQEVTILVSNDKRAYKALLELTDGQRIESVLLNPKPALWSVCLSCQVGCAMGCSFCATGMMGFIRNLTAEEICDQILFWKRYIAANNLKIHISNIVYMGMGEPFANKDAVFESIEIFTNHQIYNFGQRHLSVSTSGLVPGIEAFSERFPQINLAISLHAPNDELRSKLMPVNKTFPISALLSSIKVYLEKTNRQIFFEYILLAGENDSDKAAVELGTLLNEYYEKMKHLIHVNLIVFNQTKSHYSASEKERARKFQAILSHYGIETTIRKNLGRDIAGACGQLSSSKS